MLKNINPIAISVVAVCTSITSLLMSVHNNIQAQQKQDIRETPFVAANVNADRDAFRIEFDNYSEATSRIDFIGFATAERSVVLPAGQLGQQIASKEGSVNQFFKYYLIERFGLEARNPIGVQLDFKVREFMKPGAVSPLLLASGLNNIVRLNGQITQNDLVNALVSDLQVVICACNIFNSSCFLNAPQAKMLVSSCTAQDDVIKQMGFDL